jgi:nucleoside-diphosphate-sugar epimerase
VQANLKACVAPAKEVSGRVFNIATGTRFSLNQIFEMLSRIIGFSGAAKYASPRTGDVRHSLADITLAQKQLGYSADVSFEEGLRRTVEWYEQQGALAASQRVLVAHR